MMDSVLKNKGPKACATCAKAKARCIPGPVTDICERCHRLNKPCSQQTPAPPRKRKEPKPTRVAELERRLEDLTSRLDTVSRGDTGSRQEPSPPESSEATPSPSAHFRNNTTVWKARIAFGHLFPMEDPTSESGVSEAEPGRGPEGPMHCMNHIFAETHQKSNTQPSNSTSGDDEPMTDADDGEYAAGIPGMIHHGQPAELFWPHAEESEKLLREFQDGLAKLFPFIVIPAGTTSDQLRQKRPFLWKAVMMEACHLDGSRQILLGNQLLKDITESAFLRPQKSLDILQGLQILLAWFHYSLNSFQITNLLYLTRSLCATLGISDAPSGTKQQEPDSQRLEQMRAYAGTYYVTTLVFTTAKKPDAMMNTPYLETCCQVLQQRMEYPSDEYLVQLVRIQQLAQSIAMTFAYRSSGLQVDLPVGIMVKSFQQQLQSYKALLPEHLKDSRGINSHMHIAETLIYETGLQDNQPGSVLSPTDRLELLWSCLSATKAFLLNRLNEPVSDKPRGLCLNSFDFVYSFLTGIKLITFQTPGWDPRQVRKELRFDELLDRQITDMLALAQRRRTKRFDTDPSLREDKPTQDPFERLALKLQQMKISVFAELDIVHTPTSNPSEIDNTPFVDATAEAIQDLSGWAELFNSTSDDLSLQPAPFMDFWSTASWDVPMPSFS